MSWRRQAGLDPDTHRGSSRRAFLLAAGAAAGGLTLAACEGSTSEPIPTTTTETSIPNGTPTAGERVAALAASLENLAVYAYEEGLKAALAVKGAASAGPPGLLTLAQTARSHHAQHAARWNQLLTSAQLPAVTNVDPSVAPTVNAMLAGVSNPQGLAELALYVENSLAQTYQAAIGMLGQTTPAQTAAIIQPVEMQHAAVLYLLLGRYPGVQGALSNGYSTGNPLAFGPLGLARPASDYQGA
jgi:hypothetical protein